MEVSFRIKYINFRFPKGDCVCIPIIHSTVEEISKVICLQLIETIGREQLHV